MYPTVTTTTNVVLGSILGLICFFGVFSTMIALYAVAYLAFKKKSSPIYIIATSNLFIDLIQLTLHLCYHTPAIIMNDYMFVDKKLDPYVSLFSDIFLFCWYNLSVAQIFMSVNRLIVVCFSSYDIFTYKVVSIFVIGLYPAALFVMYFSQHYSPCCAFSFDIEFFSYSYITKENVPNYSNLYIDLPLNSMSSGICAVCYVSIILYVRKFSSKISLSENNRRRRHMKEYIYALQFCVISIFYLFSWVLFRVLPPLVIDLQGSFTWFILIPLCVAVNSMANSMVYLLANTEVQRVLLRSISPLASRYPSYFSFLPKEARSNHNMHVSSKTT